MNDIGESALPGQLLPRRNLRFLDLVLYGIILIQPTAPMPVFGVLYQQADDSLPQKSCMAPRSPC